MHLPSTLMSLATSIVAALTTCTPSSRWNITQFHLNQELTDPRAAVTVGTIHTRIINFYASSLHGPKQTFYCSARKFNIVSYEPPPQWDEWRASCFDFEALPTPRESPQMAFRFVMGMLPPEMDAPRRVVERARLELRLVERMVDRGGDLIHEASVEVVLPCDIPVDCHCEDAPDWPCEVYDTCWTKRECRPESFCMGTVRKA